jgi:hypothetical protein
MQVCHIIFLHWKLFLKIQGACHIALCQVIFLQWKIILTIQENHLMPCHLFSLKIIMKISLLKNNSKNSTKSPHSTSPFKNNLKNLRSMPRYISPLKNNSKNSKQSAHLTSHFSIVNSLGMQACHVMWCHVTFLHWTIILKTLGKYIFSNSSLNCREIKM